MALVTATPEMWKTPVLPAEEALISQALERRQAEFRAGRHCAHRALQRLGAPHQAILRDDKRAPIWPAGYLGSISHCGGYCLAACASESLLMGLGVDVEPLAPLKPGVERYIHSAAESLFMSAHPELPARLIFSIKESLYKCLYPLLRCYFGFHAVEIEVDREGRSFSYRPSAGSNLPFPLELRFHGRYLITDGHLLTSAWLTAG